MVKVDDGYYFLDLDRINEWIQVNPNDKKSVETQTVKSENGKTQQTSIIENDDTTQQMNIRYDLVKEMLITLYNAGIESDGDGSIKYSKDFDSLSVGSKLVLNSFQNSKFLVNKLKNK